MVIRAVGSLDSCASGRSEPHVTSFHLGDQVRILPRLGIVRTLLESPKASAPKALRVAAVAALPLGLVPDGQSAPLNDVSSVLIGRSASEAPVLRPASTAVVRPCSGPCLFAFPCLRLSCAGSGSAFAVATHVVRPCVQGLIEFVVTNGSLRAAHPVQSCLCAPGRCCLISDVMLHTGIVLPGDVVHVLKANVVLHVIDTGSHKCCMEDVSNVLRTRVYTAARTLRLLKWTESCASHTLCRRAGLLHSQVSAQSPGQWTMR